MALLYKKFTFEIEHNSGKLDLFECEADSWKSAWAKLGDYIRLEVDDGLDSVAKVVLC